MGPAFTSLPENRGTKLGNKFSENGESASFDSGRVGEVAGFMIETTKIVGTPNKDFWSQVHTFFPQDQEKRGKRGDLLAVLVVGGVKEGIEAVAAGREILGRFHEEYYGNLEGSSFERLREAVTKVSQENESLEIVAASLFGQVLYLTICGEGKALLKRGDKMGIILEGKEEGIETGSGILAENDFFLLGSGHFFRAVGEGVMKVALETNSPNEAVETLAPVVLGRQNMADAAAIIALVKKQPASAMRIVPPTEEKTETKTTTTQRSSLVSAILGKVKLPLRKKPLFVHREEKTRRRKIYLLVSFLLFFLLLASLGVGLQRELVERREERAKELIRLAEEKLNQGKAVSETKPGEGKVLGAEAERLLEEVLALKSTSSDEATILKRKTESFLSSLGQEVIIGEPPVFMDLGLIAEGGGGISFSLFGKELAILDQGKKKIYLLNIEKKSHLVVDYPTSAGMGISSEQRIFVFGGQGIFEVNPKSKSVALRVSKDEDWKEIVGFGTYAGNLYLLDKGNNTIWRYLATSEGFGEKKDWFMGNLPDLSKAVSMAINGAIWVLTKDSLLRFNLGKQESFSLVKMSESFSDPVRIFTSSECENLYVLDRGRSKIFVISKTGEYRASYAWEGIRKANDLVAVESLKKIFLLSGSKIYEMGMK